MRNSTRVRTTHQNSKLWALSASEAVVSIPRRKAWRVLARMFLAYKSLEYFSRMNSPVKANSPTVVKKMLRYNKVKVIQLAELGSVKATIEPRENSERIVPTAMRIRCERERSNIFSDMILWVFVCFYYTTNFNIPSMLRVRLS